ncbi:oligosaccharide flippase family protein [Candidatus Saccharibacteria bacterium]|nr:oligosaccharide flippase family protein [Candidatus Saccharibacteria bacterium]
MTSKIGVLKKNAIKAGVWYTISNFLVKGVTFLTMPIFTRIMSEYDVGMFSNITSWFSILAIVTTFEIYSSVNLARFDYKEKLDEYISSSLLLGTLLTLVFYVIVLIFHGAFESLFMMDLRTINIIFIYLLFYPAVQMFQIRNQIRYNYRPVVIVSIISAVVSSVFSILLTLFASNALEGRIYGYFIPLIIIAIVLYIYLLRQGHTISKKYWRYALAISFPLIWHLLASYLLNSADKIMITDLISPDANALYTVPYTASLVVSVLWASMNSAWSPWAYDRMKHDDSRGLQKAVRPYIFFFLTVVFIFMLVAPEILYVMGGEVYMQAKYIMPPVMIAYIFQFIYSLYVNIEFYHKKQFWIAIGTIIAALTNVGLNAIFIPMFGYVAAAYTTLVGYALLFLIHFMFVKKIKCTYLYKTSFFVKVILLSLLFGGVCLFAYSLDVLRHAIIVLIAIVALVLIVRNREATKQLIKTRSFGSLNRVNKGKK